MKTYVKRSITYWCYIGTDNKGVLHLRPLKLVEYDISFVPWTIRPWPWIRSKSYWCAY